VGCGCGSGAKLMAGLRSYSGSDWLRAHVRLRTSTVVSDRCQKLRIRLSALRGSGWCHAHVTHTHRGRPVGCLRIELGRRAFIAPGCVTVMLGVKGGPFIVFLFQNAATRTRLRRIFFRTLMSEHANLVL
jgi:hypothetical protein